MTSCAACGVPIRGFVWWDVATAKDFCRPCYQALVAGHVPSAPPLPLSTYEQGDT